MISTQVNAKFRILSEKRNSLLLARELDAAQPPGS